GRVFRDLASVFPLPGGLPKSFVEDGDNTIPFHYGHRSAEPTFVVRNFYTDENGKLDQARGCLFEGSDAPGLFEYPVASGDVIDANILFRGEIQRNGRPVETQHWVGLRR